MCWFTISEYSAEHQKHVWLEDDGRAAWVTVYDEQLEHSLCTCWVYNRASLPSLSDTELTEDALPQAPTDVTDAFVCSTPFEQIAFEFVWEIKGTIELWVDGTLTCVLKPLEQKAYNRHLHKSSSYGEPFSII